MGTKAYDPNSLRRRFQTQTDSINLIKKATIIIMDYNDKSSSSNNNIEESKIVTKVESSSFPCLPCQNLKSQSNIKEMESSGDLNSIEERTKGQQRGKEKKSLKPGGFSMPFLDKTNIK